MQTRQKGFSLIEIMIGVVIIGILSAVALPSYSAYVLRTRLTEAHAALAGAQPRLEQFWSNNRTYAGFDGAAANGMPGDTANFSYSLDEPDAATYTLVATGTGPAAGFVYTLDQAGNRATTAVPDGWTKSDNCWVDRKEGACTQ